jgi:hypothetical protein
MDTDFHVGRIRGTHGLDEEINRPYKPEWALSQICLNSGRGVRASNDEFDLYLRFT